MFGYVDQRPKKDDSYEEERRHDEYLLPRGTHGVDENLELLRVANNPEYAEYPQHFEDEEGVEEVTLVFL